MMYMNRIEYIFSSCKENFYLSLLHFILQVWVNRSLEILRTLLKN